MKACKDSKWLGGIAISTPDSGAARPSAQIVALLREFARRTAQDHRDNPEVARPQLHVINALAREVLAKRWTRAGRRREEIGLRHQAEPVGRVGMKSRQQTQRHRAVAPA